MLQQLKQGFTLIEMMLVIAIVSIMATMAIPTYQNVIIRAQINEAMALTDELTKIISAHYKIKKEFIIDNDAVNVPAPEHLIGNYVTEIRIDSGAINITLGNRINAHVKEKVLTLRPVIVIDNPKSPISWVCGYAEAVDGMEAIGINNTTVPSIYLSYNCRAWKDNF